MRDALAARYTACVQFTGSGACVTVKQPALATGSDRAAYNAAHRQCWGHLMLHPPASFDVAFSGSARSPVTEVSIQGDLLEELPLLSDIASCALTSEPREHTPAEDASASASEVPAIDLPFSVWGLVSLLLLMEGSVAVSDWFAASRPDAHAGLAAETLTVRHRCCYMHPAYDVCVL